MSFSLLSWNIMDHGPFRNTFGDRVVWYTKEHAADIMCIQEARVDSDLIKRVREIKKYDAVIPQKHSVYGGLPNTNVILTTHEIVDHGEYHFNTPEDHIENKLKDKDTGFYVWADIRIEDTVVRVYNCHLKVIGVGIKERLKSLKHITKHAALFNGPTIICGDMNSLIPRSGIFRFFIKWFHNIKRQSMIVDGKYKLRDERVFFSEEAGKHGFADALPIKKATWAIPYTSFELFKMKLDWMLNKGFAKAEAHMGPYISDHRPVHAQFII